HGGMYHQVRVAPGGDVYELTYEKPAWYQFWVHSDETFHRSAGDPVYCFTAIFAPARLQTRVYHEWLYFDEDRQEWIRTDRIGYQIIGQRDRGYRGFTLKRNLRPGKWRVDVQTAEGRTLGRIRFDVTEDVLAETSLTTRSYE
ncbi:MAG TPA: DUF2914 domain-containing protein, partial [Rhodothermales bacterium]|nr:DUF2914 domain-containing protein [Rhodothermales bacterium]